LARPVDRLANRAMFLSQVEKTLVSAKRDERFSAVLLIDLDRFKEINEARGLAIGDALCAGCCGPFRAGIACRMICWHALDSDEFGVLLPRLRSFRVKRSEAEAMAVAEKLRAALHDAIDVNGELIHIDASIGIALLPENRQETSAEVLRQADMAMAKAKAEGVPAPCSLRRQWVRWSKARFPDGSRVACCDCGKPIASLSATAGSTRKACRWARKPWCVRQHPGSRPGSRPACYSVGRDVRFDCCAGSLDVVRCLPPARADGCRIPHVTTVGQYQSAPF